MEESLRDFFDAFFNLSSPREMEIDGAHGIPSARLQRIFHLARHEPLCFSNKSTAYSDAQYPDSVLPVGAICHYRVRCFALSTHVTTSVEEAIEVLDLGLRSDSQAVAICVNVPTRSNGTSRPLVIVVDQIHGAVLERMLDNSQAFTYPRVYDDSQDDKQLIQILPSPSSYYTKQRKLLFLALSISCLLIVLSIVRGKFLLSTTTTWTKYPSEGSLGPLHQRRLESHNVSAWINSHSTSQFTLRLDDGSLMPNELVDIRENEVQLWFAVNYPQLAQYRDARRHLSQASLAKAENHTEIILLDGNFHIVHCVAARRRNFDAIGAGKHVCPRDLDRHHLEHCLKTLEDFAFRGKADAFPREWYTDVCF